jgi:hypothetical protein
METIALLFSKWNKNLDWSKIVNILLIGYSGFMLYSGISKYLNLLNFAFGMTNFSLFSGDLVFYLAYLIPAFEIILAILLLMNRTRKVAILGLSGLLITYSVYLTLFKYYATNGWCSCGSVIDLSLRQHLLFNIILILPLLVVLINSGKVLTKK